MKPFLGSGVFFGGGDNCSGFWGGDTCPEGAALTAFSSCSPKGLHLYLTRAKIHVLFYVSQAHVSIPFPEAA